jgi:hypothetical protein
MWKMVVVQSFVFLKEEKKAIHKTNTLFSQHAYPKYKELKTTVREVFTYDKGHNFVTPAIHLCLCHQHFHSCRQTPARKSYN